ncbi:hypothetical protein CTAYLR_000265 [Chrysophaeum taylorii]|uniref:Thymus-specific serine protease n=1 Tax=Chrysophaeum taylorii TaxID=2483200 RepID=A0AAD7UEP2_9STRA|nr:hypothetical protein CTAYLR_000265 [Chrysophaeum taylorii]
MFLLVVLQSAWGLPRGGIRKALREHQAVTVTDGLYFSQRLSHFDRTNDERFEQRYFANSTFFNGSGPVFLCVGGEGPALDATVLTSSVHCNDMVELAPRAGALMLALEHRFYGSSIPRASFKYLSTEEAIGDIATFHAMITSAYGLTAASKWVSWGGSYPGMVAGFARLKLPHLIHAAVSSSAPWRAKVDMVEYNDLVGRALTLKSVGGSDECLETVVAGHAAIKSVLDAGNATAIAALADLFNFCDPTALELRSVQKEWAGYGVIDVPAQDNDPAAAGPAGNIQQICGVLAGNSVADPVTALANVSRLQNQGACVDYSYDALKGPDAFTDALSWPYQTCSEYGFYQTCELDSNCPFAKGYVTLEDELGFCETLFNMSAANIAGNVNFTNQLFGGDTPATLRTYFANGNCDPWSGLGVLKSPDGNVSEIVLSVEGASHHAWTHPADTIVQASVAAAKAYIQDQVLRWLAED